MNGGEKQAGSADGAAAKDGKPRGKLLTFLLTFVVIFGGWWLVSARLVASPEKTPLPDDHEQQQGQCSLWFIGSSSIHRWSGLSNDLRPWIAHNRGVDGAIIRELIPRFDVEPARPAPTALIFYMGENDIARGASANQTFANLQTFVEKASRRFQKTPLFILSLKPSPGRWVFRPEQQRYNAMVAAWLARLPNAHYVDIVPQMLERGQPRPALFRDDRIHMLPAGYRIWTDAVRQALSHDLPDTVTAACDR